MATLKEALTTILADDADLRTLLEYNVSTKPETVVYQNSPERIPTPFISYRIGGESGFLDRSIFFDFLVWGGDLKAIHDRVYELLHKRVEVVATDWQVKGILFESSGPEIYDENLKVYFQRARYRVACCKI